MKRHKEYEATPQEELQFVLDMLRRVPRHLSTTYGMWNAGYFGGTERSNNLELTNTETAAVAIAHHMMDRYKKFTMVGLGEMLAFSMVRVGVELQEHITLGDTQLFATNREDDFTIEKGIKEALRRLSIFGSMEHWTTLMRLSQPKNHTYEALKQNKPMIESTQLIEYLQNHHHFITYLSGIDANTLAPHFQVAHPGREIDLIHEHGGGFMHNTERETTLQSIADILHPEHGIIMTNSNLQGGGYEKGYELLEQRGMSVFLQHPHVSPGYKIYAMPEAAQWLKTL